MLYDCSFVLPVAPLSMMIGLEKFGTPVKRGWNVSAAPSAPLLMNVSVPAVPVMLSFVKFVSTVVALLEVEITVLAVMLIGLAIGAEAATRFALTITPPPAKVNR